MGLEWIPDALTQLNQYPNERFWGILASIAIVIVVCTWLVAKNR